MKNHHKPNLVTCCKCKKSSKVQNVACPHCGHTFCLECKGG